MVDEHPPSPSEEYKTYSQLVAKIAKVQPPPPDDDKVFEDITQSQTPPLRLALIKSFMTLVKESWEKPSSFVPMSWRVDNLYKTHGEETIPT